MEKYIKQLPCLFKKVSDLEKASLAPGEPGEPGEPGDVIAMALENIYPISESGGDLEQAITDIQALNLSEGKTHFLLIDEDVNITGSPRTITVPEDVPVYVRKGFKFITPLVDRDPTGVADTLFEMTLTGVSGTANLNIGGIDYLVTFNSDVDTTASDFVTTHAANILSASNLVVTSSADIISIQGSRNDMLDITITNVTGDLSGFDSGYFSTLNSITGTVADNYIQLEFEGNFTCRRDSQCFEGDGLVWFGKNSVTEVWATWWGLKSRTKSGTDPIANQIVNVKALQQAINCVTLDKSYKATTTVKLPNGNIYLNEPVVAFASSLDSNPYLTGKRNNSGVVATILKLEGSERMKHGVDYGQATTITYTATWGSPLILQGLRNSVVKNIKWVGQNRINGRDNEWETFTIGSSNPNFVRVQERPDNFESGDKAEIAWIDTDISWTNGQPYCAILIDCFRTSVNDASAGYLISNLPQSTVDLYYGASTVGHQQSWDVDLTDQHCTKFVEWAVLGLKGQQNDTYLIKNIMVESQPIGLAVCQDQSRDVRVHELMLYNGVWAGITTSVHGAGIYPEVHSMHSAGGLKYFFHGSKVNGSININNIYGELVYALGTNNSQGDFWLVQGNGQINSKQNRNENLTFYGGITNVTLKFGNEVTWTQDGVDTYSFRTPSIRGAVITNALIGNYSASPFNHLQIFKDCILTGVQSGQSSGIYKPVDEDYKENRFSNILVNNSGPSLLTDGTTYPAYIGVSQGGEPLNQITSFEQDTNYEVIGYTREQGLTFHNIDSYKDITVKYYPERRYGEYDNTTTIPLEVNDIMIFSKGSNIWMAIVADVTGTVARWVRVSKEEHAYLESVVDGSNDITGVKAKVLRNKLTHAPFLANQTDTNQLTVSHYAQYSSNSTIFAKPQLFTKLRPVGDGKLYTVIDVTGDVITLDRDIEGETITNQWITPIYPALKTTLLKNTANKYGFYEVGKRYEYHNPFNGFSGEYLVCVKTGDILTHSDGKEAYTANFLLYSKEGDVLAYIGFENVTGSGLPENLRIEFYKSGILDDRPDELGVPLQYIPEGFRFFNLEDGTVSVFQDGAFITLDRPQLPLPSTTDLALELLFDNNANDTSGNGNNGTLAGSTTYGTGANGGANGAVETTSATLDYIDFASFTGLTDFVLNPSDLFTLNFFIYRTDSSSQNRVIDFRTSADNGFECFLNNGRVAVSFDTVDILSTDTLVPLSEWVMITVRKSAAGVIDIYANGQLVETFTGASGDYTTAVNPTAWRMFSRAFSGANGGVLGKVDNLRLYKRSLADSEIRGLLDEKFF